MRNYLLFLFTLVFATVANGQGALRETDIDTIGKLNTIVTDADLITSLAGQRATGWVKSASGVTVSAPDESALDIGTDDITIFFWFKPDLSVSADQPIMSKWGGIGHTSAGWGVWYDDSGEITLSLNNSVGSVGNYKLNSFSPADDKGWNFYAIKWDRSGGGTIYWYVNGVRLPETESGAFFVSENITNAYDLQVMTDSFDSDTEMDQGSLSHFIGYTTDNLTDAEVALIHRDPSYVLSLDNLAFCADLGMLSQGAIDDKSPTAATVTVAGGDLITDDGRFNGGVVSGLTEESAITSGDLILYYDLSAGALRKIDWDDFWAGTLATVDSGLAIGEVPLLVETVIDNDWLRMTSTGIEGLNDTELLTSLGFGTSPASYDDATANFTGILQNDGSNVLVDTDIGASVQAYDSQTAKYNASPANFTQLREGGYDVLTINDIGSIVEGFDSTLTRYDDPDPDFTNRLQVGNVDVALVTDIPSVEAQGNTSWPSIRSDGAGDYFWLPDQSLYDTGTTDFSIFFWIRADGTEIDGVIMQRMDAVAGWAILYDSDGIDVIMGNTGAPTRYDNVIDNIDDGKWHSVVLTFDRSANLTPYLDGVAGTPVSISAQSGLNMTTDAELEFLGSAEYNANEVAFIGGYAGWTNDLITAAEVGEMVSSPEAVFGLSNLDCVVNLKGNAYTVFDELHPSAPVSYVGRLEYRGAPTTPASPTVITSATTLAHDIGGKVYFVDAAGGTFTITLPDADDAFSVRSGATVTFINLTANTVTIDGDASDLIYDGSSSSATYSLTTEGQSVSLSLYDVPASATDRWYIISTN